MANTGYRSPGTVIDDTSYGTKVWSNPNNAKVSDNVYSLVAGASAGGISHYLKATNFGFTIPTGATINGILVQFERKRGVNEDVRDERVYIVKETGAYGTQNKASGSWSTTEAYYSYGGSTDLWGESWTPAKINDSDFGVGLSIFMDAGFCAGSVDHIRIIVYYTEAVGTNIKINIGDVFKDVDEIKINIADAWKPVIGIWINIGDVWKRIFS